MTQTSFNLIPYYQFIANAETLNYSEHEYSYLPNQKIHRTYPFIKIELGLLDEPAMDIAVAEAPVYKYAENLDTSTDLDTDLSGDSDNKTNKDADLEDASISFDLTENEVNDADHTHSNDHKDGKKDDDKDDDKLVACPVTDDSHIQKTVNQVVNKNNDTQENPTDNSKQTDDKQSHQKINKLAPPKLPPSAAFMTSTTPTTADSNISNKNTSSSEQTTAELSDIINNTNTLPKNNPLSFKTLNQTEQKNQSTATTNTSEPASTSQSESQSDSNKTGTDKHGGDEVSAYSKEDKPKKKGLLSKKDKAKKKEDEDVHNLNQEEKARLEKEAQLESYRQFVAEQHSQVEIDYPRIRISIEANALPTRMYFIMNALSAIIASYGLVINSAAVVIGAMLVAMMLGPISGVALAMIDYRIPLLRKSLMTVLAGGAMVVTVGFVVGFLHSDMALTNEILSRTQPTSMDLMIALAGGTAGAYAMISPQLSVAVVGVAVATALVPPLAASGILFAHGEGALGFGALLLAVTNIIAIQFTNALVLWFSGFRRLVKDDYKTNAFVAFLRRNAVPLFLLAGIGMYLSYNLNVVSKKQKFESDVKETINDYFIEKGNVLTAAQFVKQKDQQTVRAVIRGEFRPSSYDAKHLENTILKNMETAYPDYPPVHIQLRYLPVVVIDSNPDVDADINKTDIAILNSDSTN